MFIRKNMKTEKEIYIKSNYKQISFVIGKYKNILCQNYYKKIIKSEYSLLRRSLYEKKVHDYIIDYVKLFWETYKDNRNI